MTTQMTPDSAVGPRTPGAFSGTALRPDFPVFDTLTGTGKRLVYLDAAASAPKPRRVIDTIADAYGHHYANVHRGIYELSEDATARFEAARVSVARFVGATSPREIIFVRNATEAIQSLIGQYRFMVELDMSPTTRLSVSIETFASLGFMRARRKFSS